MTYELTDRVIVGAPLDQVWRFFSTASNLPLITPPRLRFTNHTTDAVIRQDTVLDHTIRWMGFPVRWQTRIVEWEPPRRFIDLQVRGPYSLWRHEHAFEPAGSGGTRCGDHVLYRLPLGPLGTLAHALLVRRQLLGIFRHRRQVIGHYLGGLRPLQDDVVIRRVSDQTG